MMQCIKIALLVLTLYSLPTFQAAANQQCPIAISNVYKQVRKELEKTGIDSSRFGFGCEMEFANAFVRDLDTLPVVLISVIKRILALTGEHLETPEQIVAHEEEQELVTEWEQSENTAKKEASRIITGQIFNASLTKSIVIDNIECADNKCGEFSLFSLGYSPDSTEESPSYELHLHLIGVNDVWIKPNDRTYAPSKTQRVYSLFLGKSEAVVNEQLYSALENPPPKVSKSTPNLEMRGSGKK